MNADWSDPGLGVEDLGPVTRLTLNRPHAMNALSPGLVAALQAAVDGFACDPGKRVLVIRSHGRAFCCGADLKFIAAHGPDSAEALEFHRALNRVFDDLDALDRPVIGCLGGIAMGGGLELLLTCDIVLAADDARLSDPHIRIAAIHGAGGSQRLVRSVGLQRALDIVLTAREFSAADAERWGIVARVVPADRLDSAALDLAQEIATRDPAVCTGLKQLVRLSASADLQAGLALERAAYLGASRAPAFRQAMDRFASRSAASGGGRATAKS